MKQFIYIILFALFALSCEDTIDLDLPASETKLVIDASIDWYKGTSGNDQDIKLTLTAPYFDSEVPPANNAEVIIKDSNNIEFEFVENGNSGIYNNDSFTPSINETYFLTIIYDGQTYTAEESLKSVSDIEYVIQLTGGFSGEEIAIESYYTDPAEEENFYLFEFMTDVVEIPYLEVIKDEFTNGNELFGFYIEENLSAGDEIIIRNYGISQRFYEFMFILLQQSSHIAGSPFETQPATVRSNCINQTNPDNFPLGYFRLSEVDQFVYTVE